MRLGYVHLPRFGIQRQVVRNPSLKGKPFGLVEELGGVQRIVEASGMALRLGVHPGMTLSAARALVPALVHFSNRPDDLLEGLTAVGESLMTLAPAFELSAPDGLWVDASASNLWGGEKGLGDQLLRRIHAHELYAQAAMAGQRFTARALARHGQRRLRVVGDEESLLALAELPLVALDGREAVLRETLSSLGFKRLGELAALPAGAVIARLGAVGLTAHRLARGEDDTRFTATPLGVVLEERATLECAAESLEPVLFTLKTVLGRLGARLQGRKQAVVKLSLTLKLESGAPQQLAIGLARPSAQPKLLLGLLRPSLETLRLSAPVTEVAVLADQVCEDRAQQQTLGEGPQGDADLEVVMARLTTTLGAPSVGAAELQDSHRPEMAYGIRPFRPPRSATGLLGELAPSAERVNTALEESTRRPTRLLPSPAPLDAEVDEGGRPMFVRIWGQRRKVMRMAGPERLAGAWWGNDRYRRDYYRVQCEGVGAIWLFRDADDGRYYLQGLFD